MEEYIKDPKAPGFMPVVKIAEKWYPLSVDKVEPFGKGHLTEHDAYQELMAHMMEFMSKVMKF